MTHYEERAREFAQRHGFRDHEVSARLCRALIELGNRLDTEPTPERVALFRLVAENLAGPGGGPPDRLNVLAVCRPAALDGSDDGFEELPALRGIPMRGSAKPSSPFKWW